MAAEHILDTFRTHSTHWVPGHGGRLPDDVQLTGGARHDVVHHRHRPQRRALQLQDVLPDGGPGNGEVQELPRSGGEGGGRAASVGVACLSVWGVWGGAGRSYRGGVALTIMMLNLKTLFII